MIEIISAGMLSTIQDLGRFGVMKDGFTQGGVMDAYSTRIANKLCGNDANAPVIEMTMLGITAKFTEEHIFAISGGRFDISLNNTPIINFSAVKIFETCVLFKNCVMIICGYNYITIFIVNF